MTPPESATEARIRALLFLRAVLPLVRVVAQHDEATAAKIRTLRGRVQFAVPSEDLSATLVFSEGGLQIHTEAEAQPTVRFRFRSLRSLNAFFSGRPCLPWVWGWWHPVVLLRVVQLLWVLRLINPGARPQSPDRRLLRVRLMVYLIAQGLAELARAGHAEMSRLVARSPDRVYQWSVGAGGGAPIAAYIRMHTGKIKAGRGLCPHREPFVHYAFRDAAAFLSVVDETDSQMDGLRSGRFATYGSPEYTRKIALMTQRVDALLTADM
jgi:hypothetical protein